MAVTHWATSANFSDLPGDLGMVFREMIARGQTEAQPMIVRFAIHDLIAIYKTRGLPRYAIIRGAEPRYFRVVNLINGAVSCNYDMCTLENYVRTMDQHPIEESCPIPAQAPAQLP